MRAACRSFRSAEVSWAAWSRASTNCFAASRASTELGWAKRTGRRLRHTGSGSRMGRRSDLFVRDTSKAQGTPNFFWPVNLGSEVYQLLTSGTGARSAVIVQSQFGGSLSFQANLGTPKEAFTSVWPLKFGSGCTTSTIRTGCDS